MSDFDSNGVAPLEHLGVIRATGEDAAKFLHGQLTQDLVLLPPGQGRLAAFCTPKGRVLASFVVLKHSNAELLLICARDLLAATLKRLSMFVMRAKVRLTDASADFQLCGLLGNAQLKAPGASMSPWSASAQGNAHVVQLYPAGKTERQLWIGLAGDALPGGPVATVAEWQYSEVMSGVATVGAPLSELFVPQMLNYESVGGVNFKKGCYPGQEVVARSQFRGTLKRRTYLAFSSAVLLPGQEVFAADDLEQPAGVVVQCAAASRGTGPAAVLLCLQTIADRSELRVKEAPDVSITVGELPYALLEDI